MSVIVKGMRMPEKCGLCDLFHAESPMHCAVVKGHKTVGAPYGMPRPEWCPLVELPEKHGRLVEFIDVATETDEDTGLEEVNVGEVFEAYFKMRKAKAVIEAEGE